MTSPAATATEQAEELLLSYLTPHQQMTYLKYGFFYVRGRDGQFYGLVRERNRIYRLHDHGGVAFRHNMWPDRSYDLPAPDRMLACLLCLEGAGTPWFCTDDTDSSGNHALDSRRYFPSFVAENDVRRGLPVRRAISSLPEPLNFYANRVLNRPRDYWPPVDGLFNTWSLGNI